MVEIGRMKPQRHPPVWALEEYGPDDWWGVQTAFRRVGDLFMEAVANSMSNFYLARRMRGGR